MKRLCILMITSLCCYTTAEEAVLPEVNYPLIKEVDQGFTPQRLKEYLIEKEIKHPHIVYAQALLETAWFKSKIFKENHNLFGMKHPIKRVTTALGTRYNHAYYNNWKESVDDYLLWQQMFKRTPVDTEKDYFNLLDGRYAEDNKYVDILVTIVQHDTINWIKYKPPQSLILN